MHKTYLKLCFVLHRLNNWKLYHKLNLHLGRFEIVHHSNKFRNANLILGGKTSLEH